MRFVLAVFAIVSVTEHVQCAVLRVLVKEADMFAVQSRTLILSNYYGLHAINVQYSQTQ